MISKTSRSHEVSQKSIGRMDNLETLNALLDMTKVAEELTSDIGKSEHLRSLVVEIRFKVKDHSAYIIRP